jgi:hypothetical protein
MTKGEQIGGQGPYPPTPKRRHAVQKPDTMRGRPKALAPSLSGRTNRDLVKAWIAGQFGRKE